MSTNKVMYKRNVSQDIDERTKRCVIKYYERLISENTSRKKMSVIYDVCNIFEISPRSFYNIKKAGPTPPTPTQSKKFKYTYFDSDFEIIDKIIIDLNKMNKCVYIYDVYKYIQAKPDIELTFKKCGKTTFYKIMKKMKYKYDYTKKIIREEIIKTPRIQQKIKEYLIEKKRIETLYKPEFTVYIDETAVHTNDVIKKTLQPQNCDTTLKMNKNIGLGARYMIIHAGSEEGWVKGGAHIVKNENLNAEMFEHYMEYQLLPTLKSNTLVIYDNCSIHSRQCNKTPTQSTSKELIKLWLINNNINFENNFTKARLLNLVKINKPSPQYHVDNLVKKFECHPLRLPPYCCHLNPIELIWNTFKQHLNRNNYSNNAKNFVNLITNCFNLINDNMGGYR
jgi:transposase